MARPIDVAQKPEKHVEDDDRARIADVGIVVDRRSAHVHAHVLRIEGLEHLFAARQRVVQLQRVLIGHKDPQAAGGGDSLSQALGKEAGRAPAFYASS